MGAEHSPFASFPASLRGKLLLIVFGAGLLPLAIVGLWLTRGARQSGETLLRSRLDSALVRAAQEIGDQWVTRRSALLLIGDDSAVQSALAGRAGAENSRYSILIPALTPRFRDLRDATQLVLVADARHAPRWVLDADATGTPALVRAADSLRVGGAPSSDVLVVDLPIYRGGRADTLGVIEARFRVGSLVPAVAGSAASAGAVFAVVDRTTGAMVVPLPFDVDLLRRERFRWGGEEWLTASRQLDDPAIELLAAAPSGAFTRPFEDAARRGIVALVLVALVAIAVVTLLTRRVTRSLGQLVDAAEAVARGELDHRIEPRTRDEVGRLARAFDTMTDSLRRTLSELSQRQAVAAVGEFASALAHEIRNPLSAIRLTLQHIEERVAGDPTLREPLGQVLRDINRLDGTVAGALRVARTGRMAIERIELRASLEAAMRGATAECVRRSVVLEPLPPETAGIDIRGNAAALEQLFLNLLLNAAQASAPGSHVGVRIDPDDERVTVWDTGCGFTPGARDRAFEPFFTTKPEGTGLGLTVARRIAAAHGGTIEIESAPGAGTRVHVRLPRCCTTVTANSTHAI